MKKIIHLPVPVAFMMMICSFFSCKKFTTVGVPQNQLTTASVFADDISATSAITGIYSNMMKSSGFASGGSNSITFLAALSADEMINYSSDIQRAAFYQDALNATNSYVLTYIWSEAYKYIYAANAVLEGVNGSTTLSPPVRQQLLGEAKFVRAFCHFYLVNLFGDIPYIKSTDYRINNAAARIITDSVYQYMLDDLQQAQLLLPGDFSASGGERTRPNKWAAESLLARVYLYRGDWLHADSAATNVINDNNDFSLVTDLNQVFLANSTEAIWQLEPVKPDLNTSEGNIFILTAAPRFGALSDQLLNAFDSGDLRRNNWIDSITVSGNTFYYPFKYKIKTGEDISEYSMVIRLAELFLIRAEAEAQLGLPSAVNDLNTIITRAGLPAYNGSMDKTSLLNAILHERQVELFTEWGHRWLDLNRTGQAAIVLSPIKPNWHSTSALYPIPSLQIQNDPATVQNPGY